MKFSLSLSLPLLKAGSKISSDRIENTFTSAKRLIRKNFKNMKNRYISLKSVFNLRDVRFIFRSVH